MAEIREVGRLWEDGELFLPELVAGAQATAAALGAVQPFLGAGKTGGAQPVAVLGTVRGDIHDIGKSLVGTLLCARGFRVVSGGLKADSSVQNKTKDAL